jgi:hypothetical protein
LAAWRRRAVTRPGRDGGNRRILSDDLYVEAWRAVMEE